MATVFVVLELLVVGIGFPLCSELSKSSDGSYHMVLDTFGHPSRCPCLKGGTCSPPQIQLGKTDLVIETTETTSRLYIPASQDEDCGCYTVEVRNNYGMRQAALNLTIVGR